MDSNMIRRVAFAVVAIPVLIGVVWLGEWPLIIVLFAAVVLGVGEFYALAERTGVMPMRSLGLVLAGMVPLTLILAMKAPDFWLTQQWGFLAVLASVLIAGVAVFTRTTAERPLASIAVTAFGVSYAAVLPSIAFVIRHAQWGPRSWPGTAMLFFPFIVTWVGDSAAMFAGRAIGGPKLSPTISPAKTWAGTVAGLVAGVAVAAVFAALVFPRLQLPITMIPAMISGLVMSAVGQVGDLAESLLKRDAGVKDSSALIPGHGGVLDRLDSLYFVLPVAAASYHLMGLL